MEEYLEKDGRHLRLGYTTGSCAAAAAKAAAWLLLTGRQKKTIQILTPKGTPLELEVLEAAMEENAAVCAIKKDGGDDPDVTHGLLIYARVSRVEGPEIAIDGGQGIGRVTKRGLDQPVGAAAINSVPRRMIRENLEEVRSLTGYRGGLSVVIFVPGGEEIARKTFNPRLGVQGGISILGTTGIVEPMSEQALVDTIRLELRQRRADGGEYALLTPGNYGMDFIQAHMGPEARRAVLTSNFIGDALDSCRALGFRGALLVGHIGKLVKIAGGMLNTHSKYGDCRMEILAAHGAAAGLPSAYVEELLSCATCDDALRILEENGLREQVLDRITGRAGLTLERRVRGEIETGAILFSREYGFLSATKNARSLWNSMTGG